MECIICGKHNVNVPICLDCSDYGCRCVDCDEIKDKAEFYTHTKTGKGYKKCKECFNKKIKCHLCGKELNKTYLKKHLERKHTSHSGSGLNPDTPPLLNEPPNENMFNRTLIVGPSFCGKTYLILNKLTLKRLVNPDQEINIICKNPKQYENIKIENVSIKEDLDFTIEDFNGCCVVFDDMLDSNQKLIDPFFTRGRHNDLDVYYLSQSYFDLPKRTIRNNSNIIILFQQTLKDVEHIYKDIAGFDMSYEEFKNLCREAWKEKYNYLLINRLEDKNKSKYKIMNESNEKYQVFHPKTDPF